MTTKQKPELCSHAVPERLAAPGAVDNTEDNRAESKYPSPCGRERSPDTNCWRPCGKSVSPKPGEAGARFLGGAVRLAQKGRNG